jgi:sulfate adenylyltransferase (ADP) / ATP adenylyltransferase
VTRAYVEQETPLDAADFEALARCLAGPPVLGFYNGGAAAGASQRHKHLQVVRLPLSPERELPVEALISGDRIALPLRHAFARLPAICPASELHARYRSMLREAACETGPYNLLVARGWMLLVPRSRAAFEGIPVNSLAFAGALFVRDEEELHAVERAGPMAVLRGVAFPKEPS